MSKKLDNRVVILNLGDDSDNDEDCDFIDLKLSSITMQINSIQLYKYSSLFREMNLSKETYQYLSEKILQFQNQFEIDDNNIILFFKLIQNENIKISNDNYRDLRKLSELFGTKKVCKLLDKYSQNYFTDIDIIIQQILDQKNYQNNINIEMEKKLSMKVNEFIQNEQIEKLPFATIYRILSNCDKKAISSDILFEFINKSINQRHMLFHFIDISKLSDINFDILYKKSINIDNKQIFKFSIPFNLEYIKALKDDIKNQHNKNENNLQQINKLLSENQNTIKDNQRFRKEINQIQKENDQLKVGKNILKNEIEKYKIEINQANALNNSLQVEINKLKKKNNQIHKQNDSFQSEITELKKENSQIISQNNSFQSEINKLKKENNQIISQNSSFQTEITDLKKENNQIISQNNSSQSEIDRLKKESNQISSQNKSFQSEINKLKKENNQNNAQISSFQSEITKLKKENSQIISQNKSFQSEINKLKKENNQIITQNNSFQSEISRLEKGNKQLQIENNNQKMQITEYNKNVNQKKIEIIPNPKFHGIISYLKLLFGDNLDKLLEITASSICTKNVIPQNVINYEEDSMHFCSENIPNSWLCFHFLKHKIIPTYYTLQGKQKKIYPVNWIFEGSNDNYTWIKIDEQTNCHQLLSYNPCSFKTNNDKAFKYIRIKMIGRNSNNNLHTLLIHAFEVYGTLILN